MNFYTPSNVAWQFIKQRLLQGEIDKIIILVGGINIPVLVRISFGCIQGKT